MIARGISYAKSNPAEIGVISLIVIFLFLSALGPVIASWQTRSLLLFLGFLIGSVIFGIGWCTRGAAAILGSFILTAVFCSTLLVLWENRLLTGFAPFFWLIYLFNVIWTIFCAAIAVGGAAA
ncbi:MAG: hypothetical protein MUP45_00590 [Candidatus Marinimicrobia bacterium]|nr:hypothetical protein [Candidatus Neomarinimicrobiota bacterium]